MRKLFIAICLLLLCTGSFAYADQPAPPKTMADVADHALTQIDKASNAITQFAGKLTDMAQAKAPQAWEVAKGVARVQALSDIVQPLVGALLSFTILVISVCSVRSGWKAKNGRSSYSDVGEVRIILGGITAPVATIVFCACVIALSNPWPWVGLYHPELYIAKTLLNM